MKQEAFVKLPIRDLLDPRISDGALGTLALILHYITLPRGAFPSQGTLARRRKRTTRTIQRHLNELRDLGLLTWEWNPGTRTCQYRIPLRVRRRLEKPKVEATLTTFMTPHSYDINVVQSKNINNNTPLNPPKGTDDLLEKLVKALKLLEGVKNPEGLAHRLIKRYPPEIIRKAYKRYNTLSDPTLAGFYACLEWAQGEG
jgi:hypothetical protein